jgi:RNA polymerase sigma-70 factor (ECF subfamily)
MSAAPQLDYSKLDDLALAQLCAKRDRTAFRYVIAANNQRLFLTAWSILKDRNEAEEAVQAGYVNALTAIGGYQGRSSLSTWLTRIVINEALGRRRGQRQRNKILQEEGVTLLDSYREQFARASAEASPDATVAREQLRLLIERAVGRASGCIPVRIRASGH